ncbi:hypothetical protein DFH28DRAFT_1144467 [Melampsora americana]|nr:hypothetical protein DFH28DRAFT_1144467 [Melampsora americana]
MAPKAKKGAKADFPLGSSHIHPTLLSNSHSPSSNSTLSPNVNLATFTPISAFGTSAVTVSLSATLSNTELYCLGQVFGTTSLSGTLTPNQAVLAFSNSTPPSLFSSNLSPSANPGSQQSPGFVFSSQQTSLMSAPNSMNKHRSPSVPAKRARGRPKKTEKQEKKDDVESDAEDKASQALWLEKLSDGYSDMDIIALWCSDSDNYSRWRDRIPNKRAVAGSIATYLKDMKHRERPAKEVEKKVQILEAKFKEAQSKLTSTGGGILDHEDWVNQLKEINAISVLVDSDGDEEVTHHIYNSGKKRNRKTNNGASPIEEALSICPWYCIFKPVMLERPNVVPESTRDSLGNTSFSSLASNLNLTRNSVKSNGEEESLNEDTSDTNRLQDVELDELGQHSIQDIPGSQSSQKTNKKPKVESSTSRATRDPLGLQTIIGELFPTKQERLGTLQREQQNEIKMMKLNGKIAHAILEITSNRKDDLQLKREQLRADLAMKLMDQGFSFDDACDKAKSLYPDRDQPIQGSSHDLDDDDLSD